MEKVEISVTRKGLTNEFGFSVVSTVYFSYEFIDRSFDFSIDAEMASTKCKWNSRSFQTVVLVTIILCQASLLPTDRLNSCWGEPNDESVKR